MSPLALKTSISEGLLSFPVTDFTADGQFNPTAYAARLAWLQPFGASALFVAGGTGEFFSLGLDEYSSIVSTAVEVCSATLPIIAGTGGSLPMALEMARRAQQAGAQGLLLLPHYLIDATQEGLRQYVQAVCAAVDIGVIVYNRNVCQLSAESLAILAETCPNLIGFKDGLGQIETMVGIRRRLGDRLSYLGGLPTAEVYAAAYKALGVPVYSSAVFNFVPNTAMRFYRAVAADDTATINTLLDDFFLPLLAIRNRRAGYAVSLVKAGAKIVGHDAGPVRAPLTDLTPAEIAELEALIQRVEP